MKPAILLVMLSFILLSCNKQEANNENKRVKQQLVRTVDPVSYSRGQKLYLKNCSVCHGKQAEGATNWRKRDANGKFPPPPLNGTAHTWHHSTEVLVDIIKNGTARTGGDMPAWKEVLSDQEITDILSWIKAQWPDEIYSAWYNNFQQKK